MGKRTLTLPKFLQAGVRNSALFLNPHRRKEASDCTLSLGLCFFVHFLYIFIYLTVAVLKMRHMGSLIFVVGGRIFSGGIVSKFSDQGLTGPLPALECGILATGSPRGCVSCWFPTWG